MQIVLDRGFTHQDLFSTTSTKKLVQLHIEEMSWFNQRSFSPILKNVNFQNYAVLTMLLFFQIDLIDIVDDDDYDAKLHIHPCSQIDPYLPTFWIFSSSSLYYIF